MTLRQRALKAVDFLRVRQRTYKLAAANPYVQDMLIDLAKFCRANETCFDADPRKHAAMEGRREVFLRIANHLHLSFEQLYALYNGTNFQVSEDEDEDNGT